MSPAVQTQILAYIQRLIQKAEGTIQTKYRHQIYVLVDGQRYAECRAECINLVGMLGKPASVWEHSFPTEPYFGNAQAMAGTLQGIENAVKTGMLDKIENLVTAETFDDLLEQADHLFSQSYLIPAGTLGRAVLEEHLRKWCGRAGCMPTKTRPTADDYKTALYTTNAITKIEMKHVESMIAIGNAAAHNQPVKVEEIERLLKDVRAFLLQHP